MDPLLIALLTAAVSLLGSVVAVRFCLSEPDWRPAWHVPTAPASAWSGLIPKDWPEDREWQLVHSEHIVEGTGRFQRQVTRVTQCTVKTRETTPIEPVQWLSADAGQQLRRERLQRAYEVQDVTAHGHSPRPPLRAACLQQQALPPTPRVPQNRWLA